MCKVDVLLKYTVTSYSIIPTLYGFYDVVVHSVSDHRILSFTSNTKFCRPAWVKGQLEHPPLLYKSSTPTTGGNQKAKEAE